MANTIKVAKRTGSKNGKAWTAYAVEIVAEGVKYAGLVFPPRTNEIAPEENVINQFLIK
jgi:hypothetical protein